MKAHILISLEETINTWIDSWDDIGEPLTDFGYIHETLSKEMACAAANIFDASMRSQKYALKEEGINCKELIET